MELFGTGTGYQKFALAISGVGLLLAVACGTSSAPVGPTAGNADSAGPSSGNAEILPDSTRTGSAAPVVPPEVVPPEVVPPEVVPPEVVPPEVVPSEPVDAESVPVSYTIGNNVGERIPDFAITLVDGSTVTSAELLAQRQPTFLFFFETW